MRRIPSGLVVASLVIINVAFVPPGIWPHLGAAYLLLPSLEAATASLPWRDTLVSAIVVGASVAIATLDVIGTWWYLSRWRGAGRWKGVAYGALGLGMAVGHMLLAALFTFLWVQND